MAEETSDALSHLTVLYFETSAIRHLSEDRRHSGVRALLEREVERGLLCCVSVVTVEEIITSTNDASVRLAGLELARRLAPHHLIWEFQPIVRWWIKEPNPSSRRRCEVVTWDSVLPKLSEAATCPPTGLFTGRDQLRANERAFRTAIVKQLRKSRYVVERGAGRNWASRANVLAEAQFLSEQELFRRRDYLTTLLRNVPDVTEDEVWNARFSPWLRLYLRHLAIGVVRQLLCEHEESELQGEAYDSLHLIFSSMARATVTDDAWLASALRPLSGVREFKPVAKSVANLPSFIARLPRPASNR